MDANIVNDLAQENIRLRHALAGTLFDGESLDMREAIRSELIIQGVKASETLGALTESLKNEVRESIVNIELSNPGSGIIDAVTVLDKAIRMVEKQY